MPALNNAVRQRHAVALCAAVLASASLSAQADVVYSSLVTPLPGNLPSLGYQATSTTEFGDHIALAAGSRTLQTATVTLSDWALASTYGSLDPGYHTDLTLNLYNFVGTSAAGGLIATQTINSFIPWRPEADPSCPGTAYKDATGTCYNGLAFNVTFDFSSLGVTLPEDFVFGLTFNTQSYGKNPTGVDGPYNSLNFALSPTATVGTDVNPDGVFWNTTYGPPGGLTTGTVGVFGEDTAWSGYVPAVEFVTGASSPAAVPEPSSLALLGLALAALVGVSRRKKPAR